MFISGHFIKFTTHPALEERRQKGANTEDNERDNGVCEDGTEDRGMDTKENTSDNVERVETNNT